VAGVFEHGIEPSRSVKAGNLLTS